jgi:hypothetical protein
MMHDWEALVGEQLGELSLGAEERQEVIAELAAHLEEVFDGLLRQGVMEPDAFRRTLLQAGNWRHLQRKIQAARSEATSMTNRIKQFWLPGLVTFVLSGGALGLLEKFGPRPWIVTLRGVLPIGLLYIPWLLLLPVVGALGAYLSHRAGGSGRTVFSSILFPVLPFLVAILLVLPVTLFFDRLITHNIAPMSLVMALLGWVLVPGAALLVGGLPVFLLCSRRLSFQSVSTHS